MSKAKLIFLLVLFVIAWLVYIFLMPSAEDKELISIPVVKEKQVVASNITIQPSSTASSSELSKNPLVSTQDKKPKPKPTLRLDLKVEGVFLGKKKNSGYALITYNGAPQQVYTVGSVLSEGVILKNLSKEEVIIDNHGKLEKHLVIVIKEVKSPTKPLIKELVPELMPKVVNDTPPMNDFTEPPPYVNPLDSHLTPAQSLATEFIPPPPDDDEGRPK